MPPNVSRCLRLSDLISRVADTSDTYPAWKTTTGRLFVANGYRDPWLYATHSTPAQNLQSTELRPISFSDGFHCLDMSIQAGQYSESVYAVQKEAIETMKWIASFSPKANPVDSTPSKSAARLLKTGGCWPAGFLWLALSWLLH